MLFDFEILKLILILKIDDEEYIYEKEDLLHLIKDKHSPWYIEYDWSNEAKTIRELYLNNSNKLNLKNIEGNFKTLRLVDKNVFT